MTPEEALEVWERHIRSIEESLNVFLEYSLPDAWISREILQDLKESLAEISRLVENEQKNLP